MSPLDVFSLLGPMLVLGPLLLWLVVMGPLILYPVARWRAAREPYMDPQLGMKVALHYFKLLGFHLLLLGGALLLWTIISKTSGDKNHIYRTAFGFIVPGAIVFAAHVALIKKSNDVFVPGVRRLFLGYNMIITGLIGFTALVLGFQVLFAKGSSGDAGRMFLAAILVYCGAWGTLGMQFARTVLGPGDGGAMPTMAPPGPMPPPADASGGVAAAPGLPPLSQGQYPPIDPTGAQ